MRQIWMRRRGGPDVLEVREAPSPRPGPGEVRIAVAAAGVNFADVMMRRGLYPDAPRLPAVAGYEVAGEIVEIGAGVDPARVGRRVVAMCRFGGYSEEVVVPAAHAWPVPADIDPVTAAALPVAYLTAWQMVRVMAPVTSGDRILVHGAAGGVGQAVIQLCRPLGARLLGSASPAKHARLRAQGLEHVFDSRRTSYAAEVREAAGGGVDVALEPRHGRWIMESYRCLDKCGRLVLFGFSSAARGRSSGTLSALGTLARVPWLQLNPVRLMNDNRALAGINLGRMWDQGERTGRWMEALLDMLAAGEIAPVIDGVYAFAAAAEAHARLEDRGSFGKLVLTPDGTDTRPPTARREAAP